jgi:3-oxoacyl-[acyl-carrier protein] reductase
MQRIFLIAGASKGIGLALARRLAGQGHRVIAIACNPADDFTSTLYLIDLGDAARSEGTVVDTVERHRVDGIVNSVRLLRPRPLGSVDLAALDEMLRLNLHPALMAVQAALPARRWGRVVNIASLTILGSVERTAYAAAKRLLWASPEAEHWNWR